MSGFSYQTTTEEQRADLERQLLTQRLTQLEGEHAAAVFGLNQIEQAIEQARTELAALDRPPPA